MIIRTVLQLFSAWTVIKIFIVGGIRLADVCCGPPIGASRLLGELELGPGLVNASRKSRPGQAQAQPKPIDIYNISTTTTTTNPTPASRLTNRTFQAILFFFALFPQVLSAEGFVYE